MTEEEKDFEEMSCTKPVMPHALKKPCIHIFSTPMDKLPFDVLQWKTTKYNPGQTHKLWQGAGPTA
jgi:hypothetical protein